MNYQSHKVMSELKSYLNELELTGVQVCYIMSAATLAHVHGKLEVQSEVRDRREHSRVIENSFKCLRG